MVCLNLRCSETGGAYDLRWQGGENTHSVDVVWGGNVGGATHRSLAVT